MALINCPNCTKEISDRAAFCPHCKRQSAPADLVNAAGFMADEPSFSGSIFEFGILNCIKTENKNFWGREWGRSVYVSSPHGVHPSRRINKTKNQITKTWVLGLLGMLGLHFFTVGRFITGSLRFLYGSLMLVIGIVVTYSYRETQDVEPFRIMLVFLVAALVPAIIDLIMIRAGKFCDVFRSYVQ